MPERKKRKKRKKKGKKGKKKKKNYKISRRMLTSAPSIDVSLILLQCLGLRRRYARPSTAQHSPPPKKKIVSISVCTPPKKQFFSTMPQILQQMLCRGMVFRAVPAGFSVRPASPRLFFFFPFLQFRNAGAVLHEVHRSFGCSITAHTFLPFAGRWASFSVTGLSSSVCCPLRCMLFSLS